MFEATQRILRQQMVRCSKCLVVLNTT